MQNKTLNIPTIFKEIIIHDKEMDTLRKNIFEADAVSIDVGKLIRTKKKQRIQMSRLAQIAITPEK